MKSTARSFLSFVFLVLVAPLALPIRWSRRWDKEDHIFRFGSHCVSLVPGLPGVFLRRAYYLTVLPHCGDDVVIEFGTIFAQRHTDLGKRVYIGAFCNIGMSSIGDDVLIGSNVDIISGQHVHCFEDPDLPIRDQGGRLEKISVGEGSWIGNRSIIMADVGRHAVVGAGAVVTRSCGEYTVNVGNPARTVRHRLEQPESFPEEEPLRRVQHA